MLISNENNNMGIYEIVNLYNEKVYIGSSKNIERRWNEHIYQLRDNKHHSIKLQRAWNKYGEENFEFNILQSVDNINDLFPIEQEWMNKTNCCEQGYNISEFAGEVPYYISKRKKEDKIKKQNYYKDEISKLKDICLNSINYNELIDLQINIREKEYSAIVFNKQSIVYNVLPIYYEVINNYILPEIKDELLNKLEIIVYLQVYNKKYIPEFRTCCDLINNKIGISVCPYYNIITTMNKYNISLKDSIIKCVTEIEYMKFRKI